MADWTGERVATLRKLWAEGLSGSQIAKELGGVTRNAVIGKVHRLGLAGRPTLWRPAKRPVRTARPRIVGPTAPRMRPPSHSPAVVIPELEPLAGEIAGAGQCRWIQGEPGTPMCGRPEHKRSYCAHHWPLVYIPGSRQTRRNALARFIAKKATHYPGAALWL